MQTLKIFILIGAVLLCQGGTFVVDPAKNAVWHNAKGIEFLELKYYLAAINEFKLAIMLNPDSESSATFYNNMGITCCKIGDYETAERNFQKSLELKPFYLEYYKNFINTYKQRNLLGNLAIKKTNELKATNNNLQTLLMLGLVHKELGNKEFAIGYFRKFVFSVPDEEISEQIIRIIKELESS